MSMKLCYFNGRGLAETSRFIFAITEQPYTDFRYPLDIIDWSTYTFRRDEFDQDKADGKLACSLNKLPYLEVDGEVIPQSKSIERYLARKFGMMGSNEVEAAQIDAICEYVRDFKTEYQRTRLLKDDARDTGMTKWFEETLPEKLTNLDKIVGETFSVGNQTSLADVTLYTFIAQFFDEGRRARAACDKAPNIESVVLRISELPTVQKWIANRPTTDF
jgi:prostaglandin-H2 D-isomerase / glutathione transferase